MLAFLFGSEAAGHVVNHSPPSGAEVKNVWSYKSSPPLLLCLHVEEMDNFTFACASVYY
jgi:hypothetical protein